MLDTSPRPPRGLYLWRRGGLFMRRQADRKPPADGAGITVAKVRGEGEDGWCCEVGVIGLIRLTSSSWPAALITLRVDGKKRAAAPRMAQVCK